MDLGLTGRRALVTASSAGIGTAVVRRLAAGGCAVMVHGRDRSRAGQVADALSAEGAVAEVVLGDLTQPDQAAQIAERARAWGVEILVNNAGPFVEHDGIRQGRSHGWRRSTAMSSRPCG